MSRKNLLFSLISFALIISLVSSTVLLPVGAASTSQMRDEISELQDKSEQLEKEIAALKKDKAEQNAIKAKLEQQIAITQEEISACTRLINSYKSEIKECEAKIAQKEEEIEQTKFLFRQRMRSIYMSGSTNNDLLVLLDSENFSDYLALSEVSRAIAAHDKKLVNEMTEAIAEINEAQKQINEKMSAQNDIKKELASKQAKLRAQQSEVNGIISDLSSDQSALEKENKEYEDAINRLEAEIAAALAGSNNSGSNPVFTSGTFTWPVPGYYNITSYYGYRIHPIYGTRKLHGGIDIASSGIAGKPIVAAADGIVLSAGWNSGGFGNWVMINHGIHNGNQFATIYAHMKYTPLVKAGQSVKAGQTIGYVGTTGASTGNHLHFEVRVNGSRTDPMNYFSRVG